MDRRHEKGTQNATNSKKNEQTFQDKEKKKQQDKGERQKMAHKIHIVAKMSKRRKGKRKKQQRKEQNLGSDGVAEERDAKFLTHDIGRRIMRNVNVEETCLRCG